MGLGAQLDLSPDFNVHRCEHQLPAVIYRNCVTLIINVISHLKNELNPLKDALGIKEKKGHEDLWKMNIISFVSRSWVWPLGDQSWHFLLSNVSKPVCYMNSYSRITVLIFKHHQGIVKERPIHFNTLYFTQYANSIIWNFFFPILHCGSICRLPNYLWKGILNKLSSAHWCTFFFFFVI